MDNWAGRSRTAKNRKYPLPEDCNELGKRNLSAIERIVVRKYRRGLAFNRQHPLVDVLLSGVMESAEVLDAADTRVPRLSQ
jgi:hypothetical protein